MGLSARDRARFADLDFAAFRRLAQDESLHPCERIGFPRSYREGHEARIFADIASKTQLLKGRQRRVVDIGPGCSELAHLIIACCQEQGHELLLIDAPEMLAQLPDQPGLTKLEGSFPECQGQLPPSFRRADTVLCYSVFHYVFAHQNPFQFLDAALHLIEDGGELLVGDVPNHSKRQRFFATPAGKAFHRKFMTTDSDPELKYGELIDGQIDDASLSGFIGRAQVAGFDAYLLPQDHALPMANRRDDLLFCKAEATLEVPLEEESA